MSPDVFPTKNGIPREVVPALPIHQRETLVNGELKPWMGRLATVQSAICLRQADGSLKQLELGSHPTGGIPEAQQAFDAAVAAYDDGGGEWPTMAVAPRIACMKDFTKPMAARREPIVKLIMWEIAKTRSDSEKEFDRTVDYSRDNRCAARSRNSNSRFQVVKGTIGQIRRTPLGVVLCMGPYNYPVNETFATLIPSLIMGNTMVFKPPKFGVLLFQRLLEAFQNAFP